MMWFLQTVGNTATLLAICKQILEIVEGLPTGTLPAVVSQLQKLVLDLQVEIGMLQLEAEIARQRIQAVITRLQ